MILSDYQKIGKNDRISNGEYAKSVMITRTSWGTVIVEVIKCPFQEFLIFWNLEAKEVDKPSLMGDCNSEFQHLPPG